MQAMETSRETKIGKFDMSSPVEKNVVRFDITMIVSPAPCKFKVPRDYSPMNKAQLVNRLDSQDNLGDIESGNIFREYLILDQHCHQISTR